LLSLRSLALGNGLTLSGSFLNLRLILVSLELSVQKLRSVSGDLLDQTLGLEVLNGGPSKASVDSQLIRNGGDGNKTGLGNVREELGISSLVEVDSVVSLLLGLARVPLLMSGITKLAGFINRRIDEPSSLPYHHRQRRPWRSVPWSSSL
jgi:hypothetical protein